MQALQLPRTNERHILDKRLEKGIHQTKGLLCYLTVLLSEHPGYPKAASALNRNHSNQAATQSHLSR